MAEQEDPEFTPGHAKITTIHRTVTYENDLKTSRKDFLQIKI